MRSDWNVSMIFSQRPHARSALDRHARCRRDAGRTVTPEAQLTIGMRHAARHLIQYPPRTEILAMNLFHAVAFVDHHTAQVLQFAPDDAQIHTVHEHLQFTRQHRSEVRSEHEFFGEVCDVLEGIATVLVVGGHNGLADFRHYVDKHRPLAASRIAGYEVVDHPTDNQLIAFARTYFTNREQMVGIQLPK